MDQTTEPQVPETAEPQAAAESKPKRRGLVIGVVVGAVAVLATAGAWWWYSSATAAQSAKKHLAAAETSWQNATTILSAVDNVSSDIESRASVHPNEVKNWAITLKSVSTSGKSQLDIVRAEVTALPPSSGREAYLKAISLSEQAMAKASEARDQVLPVVDAYSKLQAERDELHRIDDQVFRVGEQAIDASNAGRWSQALSAAQRGARMTSDMKRLASQMRATSAGLGSGSGGELAAASRLADLEWQRLALAVQMAKDGKAGRWGSFNSGVDRYNRLADQLNKLPNDLPGFYSFPASKKLARSAGPLLKEATSLAAQAKTEHAAAVEELRQ
jgi:hypothetical protein